MCCVCCIYFTKGRDNNWETRIDIIRDVLSSKPNLFSCFSLLTIPLLVTWCPYGYIKHLKSEQFIGHFRPQYLKVVKRFQIFPSSYDDVSTLKESSVQALWKNWNALSFPKRNNHINSKRLGNSYITLDEYTQYLLYLYIPILLFDRYQRALYCHDTATKKMEFIWCYFIFRKWIVHFLLNS